MTVVDVHVFSAKPGSTVHTGSYSDPVVVSRKVAMECHESTEADRLAMNSVSGDGTLAYVRRHEFGFQQYFLLVQNSAAVQRCVYSSIKLTFLTVPITPLFGQIGISSSRM